MAAKALTTTSYAILGQLALRPWTAYALTKQMRRNVRFFWPRAESRIYEEAKRLVAAGLATAATGSVGRRSRTTYAITPAGERELRAWLEEAPSRGHALEFEAALRVFLANLSSPDALLAAIDHARNDAHDLLRLGRRIGHEYLEGRAPFQELVQHRALTFDLLTRHALAIAAWADEARATVESWEELGPAERERRALAAIREGLEAVEAELAAAPTR